jgi:hypothetical protein
MYTNGVDHPYPGTGMSGRPRRMLTEFISQLVCKSKWLSVPIFGYGNEILFRLVKKKKKKFKL